MAVNDLLKNALDSVDPDWRPLRESELFHHPVRQEDIQDLVSDLFNSLLSVYERGGIYGIWSLDTVFVDHLGRYHLLPDVGIRTVKRPGQFAFYPEYAAYELTTEDPDWPLGEFTDVYGLGMLIRTLILKETPKPASERMQHGPDALADNRSLGISRQALRVIDMATGLKIKDRLQTIAELVERLNDVPKSSAQNLPSAKSYQTLLDAGQSAVSVSYSGLRKSTRESKPAPEPAPKAPVVAAPQPDPKPAPQRSPEAAAATAASDAEVRQVAQHSNHAAQAQPSQRHAEAEPSSTAAPSAKVPSELDKLAAQQYGTQKSSRGHLWWLLLLLLLLLIGGGIYLYQNSQHDAASKQSEVAEAPEAASGDNAEADEASSPESSQDKPDSTEAEAAKAGKAELKTEEKAQDNAADADKQKQAEAEKKAEAEADEKAKAEADKKAKAEADRKAKAEADKKAKEQAEKKAKEQAELKAKAAAAESEKQAKEELERKAKEEAERKAKEEAERRAKAQAEREAKAAARKAEEEAAAAAQASVASPQKGALKEALPSEPAAAPAQPAPSGAQRAAVPSATSSSNDVTAVTDVINATGKTPTIRRERDPQAELAAAQAEAKHQAQNNMGTIIFRVTPWGNIKIDGRSYGATPPIKQVRLNAGTHTVQLDNGRGSPVSMTVEVTPGGQVTVTHIF